jgi:NADH dehydrogenase
MTKLRSSRLDQRVVRLNRTVQMNVNRPWFDMTRMRTAIFGGTGFVGSYLVDALLDAGHEPSLLVRPGSEKKVRHADRCRLTGGEIDDGAAIARTLEGCGAAIYLIGILRENPAQGITFKATQYEGARRVIDAVKSRHVERFLLMSANGVKQDGTGYQRSKFEAERYLEGSGLRGTVMRPAVIFGDPRGRMEFATELRNRMIRPPIPAPAFFSGLSPRRGTFSMTPVFVEDVARAFQRSLDNDATVGRTLHLGGSEELPWPAIIRRIAEASGRRKLIVPVPAKAVHVAAALLDRFSFFPITRDQLAMLMEGNTVPATSDFDLLGLSPAAMTVDRLAYLRS